MSRQDTLTRNLSAAVNEKDVENAWRAFIQDTYKDGSFSSPFKCDGFLVCSAVKMLCEFKHNPLLKTKEHYPVIAQSIYYIKKFIDAGQDVPNVIFIADKDECFVLPIHIVMDYTKRNYDWSISPCDAGKNIQLISDLMKDENINPFVFDIDSNFTWASVHNYIERSVKQIKADISITCKTIPAVFEYWCKNVMKHSLTDNEHIEVFFKVLTNPRECYKHPKKDGCLVVSENEYKIDKKGFNGFFNRFKETHNPIEIRELTANKDRLIKEISRRRTGAFFTPSDWVGEAHKMLMEHLGENYRDEYIFWDCSCGTANLTRDYSFKELYLSTLEQTDLNIIDEAGYNKDAVKFQFDFLNDSLDKIPSELLKALESGKKIVFFNNPPYATANDVSFSGKTKNGICDTLVNKMMKDDDIGASSQQLYIQFMYRIMKLIEKYNLKDSVMATFSKSKFMNSGSFEGFRKSLNVSFVDGIMFQANHFADVSDAWGIAFTLFKGK
jgi:hypothetical protein